MGRELIVLTQNIWGGAPLWKLRRRTLAGRIAGLRPDIIGLQEVHARDPSGVTSQAHQLGDLAGGYRTVFAPGRVTPSGRCEGVAILSRFPIREHSVAALTLDGSDALDRLGPRVVLHALLDSTEGPVDAFVTHLSVSRRARARTVRELLAFADRESARSCGRGAILLGDLNAEPDEPTSAVLEGDGAPDGNRWGDAWKLANGPRSRGGTWPSVAPYRRIDYIFLRPGEGWRVHRCERGPIAGSDHRGVVARLSLDEGRFDPPKLGARITDDGRDEIGGPPPPAPAP
jgi:endonuclease/exonuclease/phosphatase family metal-dependent hydrolase